METPLGEVPSLTSIDIPFVTSICEKAICQCTAFASGIPTSATAIEQAGFSRCTALTSINIPSSVTSIGEPAVYGCLALTSITIPTPVTAIDKSAFSGCTALTSIDIPISVTSIGA